MDNTIEGPSVSTTRGHVINHYWDKLGAEIFRLLSNETQQLEDIAKLSMELSAFKSAFSVSEREKQEAEKDTAQLRRSWEAERRDLENQIIALKGSERRVVCVIDGDGTIFSGDLIAQGQAGGYAAAQMLTEYAQQYFLNYYSLDQFQLWTYIFYNKRGLLEAIGRAGLYQARAKLDDFMIGFNQAAGRFLMVDVGSGKEVADAKVKVHLEDNVRLPQTFKVIFGGCHDNGYVTTLRSVITDGFQSKLILLRGYTEMAAGIEDLGLPSMSIPDLFMPQKLVSASMATHVAPGLASITASEPLASRNATPPPSGNIGNSTPPPGSTRNTSPCPEAPPGLAPSGALTVYKIPPLRPSLPPSYSSALQTVPMTVDLVASESDSSSISDISEAPVTKRRSSSVVSRPRHIMPNIPLSKHKPAPCTLFYLATCRHGVDCKYGHDYLLQDEHYEEMRQNAKKGPCPALNRGDECSWGEECIYGHVCPEGVKCRFKAQDRCKFGGVEMHSCS